MTCGDAVSLGLVRGSRLPCTLRPAARVGEQGPAPPRNCQVIRGGGGGVAEPHFITRHIPAAKADLHARPSVITAMVGTAPVWEGTVGGQARDQMRASQRLGPWKLET